MSAGKQDISNEGGTAPGGTVPFMGAVGGAPDVDPVTAAKMQHYGLADESPAEKGDVPVHPGLAPGQFRTARDANYAAPDGETPVAANGLHRGESPFIPANRGAYRP